MVVAFIFSLLLQGIAPTPVSGGAVRGTVKDAAGKPAVGIRISVLSLDDRQQGVSLAALAETDTNGLYRLEGVPLGRYVVAAGWLNFPTYFPGVLSLADAKPLTITAGSRLSGIDFVIHDASHLGVALPIKLTIEGETRIPASTDGSFAQLSLVDEATGRTVLRASLDAASFSVPISLIPGLYFAKVENLPAGYTVKSMSYTTDNPRAGVYSPPYAFRLELHDLSVQSSGAVVFKFHSELAITVARTPALKQ